MLNAGGAPARARDGVTRSRVRRVTLRHSSLTRIFTVRFSLPRAVRLFPRPPPAVASPQCTEVGHASRFLRYLTCSSGSTLVPREGFFCWANQRAFATTHDRIRLKSCWLCMFTWLL